MAKGSLAKHGKKNKTGKKNTAADFNIPGTDNGTNPGTNTNTEVSTDNSTVDSTNNNTETSTEDSTDISSLLRQQLAPTKKKPGKKQISAWVDKDVYTAYMKYKGNGEKGQKSELINKLLRLAFELEEK